MSKKDVALKRLKVIVIGVENSGKTTLVRSLTPNVKSIEHSDGSGNSITVGLDIGKVELGGHALHFFGTPGHERFSFVRKVVSHGAHIGILMIDSVEASVHGIDDRDRNYEKELIDRDIPYIICANKRDQPNVLPISEIESHFKADVYPTSAKTGDGVEEIRQFLTNLVVSKNGDWLPATSSRKSNFA